MAVAKKVKEVIKEANESIELHNDYNDHSNIVYGTSVIEFIDGKATVLTETAEILREQGLIK